MFSKAFEQETRKALEVRGNDLEQEVGFSGHDVTFEDFRNRRDDFPELVEILSPPTTEGHAEERGHAETQFCPREQRHIAIDDSRFLESPDAPIALRRRQVRNFGELRMRRPRVTLQALEDTAVGTVEFIDMQEYFSEFSIYEIIFPI